MTPGVRVAVLYATAMLVILAVISAVTPTSPLPVRLFIAHSLLGATFALFAWLLLLDSGGPGSFPSLVNSN